MPKKNQVSLVYYSILSSSWIKKESKLCYFPKICSNTNSSKTWNLHDLTGTSVSPLRTSWTSKRSCLSLRRVSEGLSTEAEGLAGLHPPRWWNHLCDGIKMMTRRNLAEFYNIFYARSLVSSRNSWPCCCNRLIKTAAANSIAASIYVHIIWAQKKFQEPAASKITQQKGSVNFKGPPNCESSALTARSPCILAIL